MKTKKKVGKQRPAVALVRFCACGAVGSVVWDRDPVFERQGIRHTPARCVRGAYSEDAPLELRKEAPPAREPKQKPKPAGKRGTALPRCPVCSGSGVIRARAVGYSDRPCPCTR